jgi:hypothetical protein
MKKIRNCILLLMLINIGCQSVDDVEKPEHFLNKSEMKNLIYDMVLLDAAVSVNKRRLEELDIEFLEFLSKKYNIDSTDLKQNILYYNLNFDENTEIYTEVKDSISKLEKVYDSISKVSDSLEKVELKKQDSIQKLKDSIENKEITKSAAVFF